MDIFTFLIGRHWFRNVPHMFKIDLENCFFDMFCPGYLIRQEGGIAAF